MRPTENRTYGALCGVLVLSQIAWCQGDTKLGIEATVDYVSKYIWRGQNLQDDGAIQPAISFTYGALSGAIWGSIELSNINHNSGQMTEIDYSLGYSDAVPGLEAVRYSLGVIHYTFPSTDLHSTTELYAGLGFDLPLNPTFTLYRDVDEADGTYVSFGLGHAVEQIMEWAPGIPVGLELNATLGWASSEYNEFYWGTEDGTANDLALSAGFPFQLSGWSITPSIHYVTLLNHDIRAADTYAPDSDYLFFGIRLSTAF